MATQKGNIECPLINFQLTVKNNVEPSPTKPFTVPARLNQGLLEALEAFKNNDFSFQTAVLQSPRRYVVEVTVDGRPVRAKPNQFWETLLWKDNDIKPIGLSTYQLQNNDHVYLRFSQF